MKKRHTYYPALKRSLDNVVSGKSLKQKLGLIVRSTASAIGGAASLILLDSTGNNLVHSTSWKLPKYYLQKGLLDRRKSLDEISHGRPVIISNIENDDRLQFRDLARKAGITGITGIPLIVSGTISGSLRVYSFDSSDFGAKDLEFLQSMANLAGLAIELDRPGSGMPGFEIDPFTSKSNLSQLQEFNFAHPSEAEFAHLLDFYNIEWVYEPRSFVLEREGDRITEMFSPDFYLPAMDLYVEITTLKQKLITYKNRKIRRLRELYPGVKITLLNKDNYNKLLARYGAGPLGQARAHGIRNILYSAEQISTQVNHLAAQISADYQHKRPVLLGIQRGFICFMADLIRQISIPIGMDFMAVSSYSSGARKMMQITKDVDLELQDRHVLVVEDIIDTGMTLSSVLKNIQQRKPASLEVCTLLDRRGRRIVDINIKYAGFEIKDEFVVGYGLDYREEYRNLPFIGVPEISISTQPEIE